MQERAGGYIGATAFGRETGAVARPPRPFPSCHLERGRDFTKSSPCGVEKLALSDAEGTLHLLGLRNLGTGRTGRFLDLGERDCLMAKVRAAINRGPPSELQDSWKACPWGYPPPPFFRYIRIIGLARSSCKVFKNKDLYGKYSGIMT